MQKQIRGYEGIYDITSDGRIYSHNIKRYMRTYENNKGYELVTLSKEGEKQHFLVHRLVAKHFVEGYEEGKEVNHKDGIKTNNKASNLEWVTRRENVQHAIKQGKFDIRTAQETARVRNRKPVAKLDLEGNTLKIFGSAKEAEEKTGTPRSKISMVCNGHRRTSNGFSWKFVS